MWRCREDFREAASSVSEAKMRKYKNVCVCYVLSVTEKVDFAMVLYSISVEMCVCVPSVPNNCRHTHPNTFQLN